MREYGKVHSSFWNSTSIRNLSEDGRTLALYLLTCSHSTIAGVFRLPDGYACEDLQWSTERVCEGFAELFRNGFANRCETTKWVWVCKHFDWNQPENPNQRKAVSKVAHQVPDACAWIHEYKRVCWQFLDFPRPEESNPSGTLPKPFRNQEQEQDQEQVQEDRPLPPLQGGTIVPVAARRKSAAVTFKTFLDNAKKNGEKAISDYKPVWQYAERAGIPNDFVELCWAAFRAKYAPGGTEEDKRYIDWRKTFRNAVEGNWFKLWSFDLQGQCYMTPQGRQQANAQRGAE